MSLETILHTIATSGETELAELHRETATQVQAILTEAEKKAHEQQELVCQSILLPVAGEKARRLHQARLEALRIVGEARDQVVTAALTEVHQRLTGLRDEPAYAGILQSLTEETIRALGEEELEGAAPPGNGRPELGVDPRDHALLQDILHQIALDLPIEPRLDCWGGVVLCSGDGRITVTNTLEARLERATAYLRQKLATFFTKQESEQLSVSSNRRLDGSRITDSPITDHG